jgi:DNA repair protein recO|nr:DNA repair protein RecO [uncultured Peptostreptococcus sp.]
MIVLDTQGIVLRAVKYRDKDLILTIFTRKYGKVSAIAKGAQGQKSRFLSASQLFSYNNYNLRKQKDMFTLYQADNIKSFYNISMDFESFSYASFIIKLVEANIVEGQPNNRLFELLAQTLFLYSEKIDNKNLVLDAFLLKFVDYMGYRPNLDRCTICGNNNLKYAVFSVEDGGLVCNNCDTKEKFFIKLDQTTISLMQYILNNDIIVCSKAKVAEVLVRELFSLLKIYLVNYFENVSFKSLDLLKTLK